MKTLASIVIALSLSLSTAHVQAQGKRPAPGGGLEQDDRCGNGHQEGAERDRHQKRAEVK